MDKRVITDGDWEFPPSHGYGEGVSRFFAQVELSAFDISACVMTVEHDPSDINGERPAWLYWNDGVTNDWCEELPSLSAAVGRMAVLLSFGEGGWIDGFALDAPTFGDFWKLTVVSGA